jgi:hypothetical protein
MATIVKANRDEWIAPVPTNPTRSVILEPNPNTGPFEGWICEHAAPQAATEDSQIIVCDVCLAALDAGAETVKIV